MNRNLPQHPVELVQVSTTDNMDEFKDLFTKEIPTSKLSGNSPDSDGTPDLSARSTPLASETIYRQGQTKKGRFQWLAP